MKTNLYKKNFNGSGFDKILNTDPYCDAYKILEPTNGTYDFTGWGSVYVEAMYDVDQYCLQESSQGAEGWILKVCDMTLINYHKYFHTFLMTISLIVFLFTICVYASYAELRTTHGKCLISMLSSLILMYVVMPSTRFGKFLQEGDFMALVLTFLMIGGLILTFLWFTTICYHVMRKIKNIKNDVSPNDRFLPYFIFVTTMFCLTMIIFLLDVYSFKHSIDMQYAIISLFLAYGLMLIFDVLLILWACFLLCKHSITSKTEEQIEKFKLEKKWFLMHSSTVILMVITFPFAIFAWQARIYASYEASVVIDGIKLLTALNFCVVFVARNSIKEKLLYDCHCMKERLTAKFKKFH